MSLQLYTAIHCRYVELFVLTVCIFNNDALCNPVMWNSTDKLLLNSCIMGTFPGMGYRVRVGVGIGVGVRAAFPLNPDLQIGVKEKERQKHLK